MSQTENLLDFLKTCLTRSSKTGGPPSCGGPPSYAAYLRQSPAADEFGRAMAAAEDSFSRSLPGYGREAEALAAAGLTNSGYSNYLTGLSYGQRQNERQALRRQATALEQEQAAGYAAYLDAHAKGQQKTASALLDTLLREGIADYDTAYLYALQQGLGEQDAQLTAALGVQLAGQKSGATVANRYTILNHILNRDLDYENAYAYAMASGLPPEEARQLAEISQQLYAAQTGRIKDLYEKLYGPRPE
ncbi:MAG: hypothetical protein WDA00_06365 [Eubacteriales bacterium]